MRGESLFIADLHLDSKTKTSLDAFRIFLNSRARDIDHLYILGDLFEVWIGDDDDDLGNQEICQLIHDFQSNGTAVSIQVGNRDFLLGESFADRTGCTLLEEILCIDLYGTPTLLLHGDQLCTRDSQYQAFRNQIRSVSWRSGFLAKPLEERRIIAGELRDASAQSTSGKNAELMEIDNSTLEDLVAKHQCTSVIHGHTHLPCEDQFEFDSGIRGQRLVLGAWGQSAQIGVATAEGLRLEKFDASQL